MLDANANANANANATPGQRFRAARARAGQRFRAARARAGLTQTQVAEALEVRQKYISDVETGARRPSTPWLLWAALKLGWGPEQLDPELAGLVPAHAPAAKTEGRAGNRPRG